MGHLHQWSLSWSLSWSLPGSFTYDNNFATSRILYLVLTEGEKRKKTEIYKRIGKGKTLSPRC